MTLPQEKQRIGMIILPTSALVGDLKLEGFSIFNVEFEDGRRFRVRYMVCAFRNPQKSLSEIEEVVTLQCLLLFAAFTDGITRGGSPRHV
jgi:hypothetical protein